MWAHPVLRPLALTVAVFAFVGEAGNAVFVILVTERIGLGSIGFGMLIAVDAMTAIAASFLVAPFVARTSHSTSMRFAIVTYAIASLLFGFATVVAAAFLAAFINGMSDPSWNVVSATVINADVPAGLPAELNLFTGWPIIVTNTIGSSNPPNTVNYFVAGRDHMMISEVGTLNIPNLPGPELQVQLM